MQKKGDRLKGREENPALPNVIEERDRTIIQFGRIEVVQTANCITIQKRCRIRLDSGLADDSSKQPLDSPFVQFQE